MYNIQRHQKGSFKTFLFNLQMFYKVMDFICPPGYHHSGLVVTCALGHMMTFSHLPKTTSCHERAVVIRGCAH